MNPNPMGDDRVFSEDFMSDLSVTNNGGVRTGVVVNNGATFDTNTDKIIYSDLPSIFYNKYLTVKIVFTPNFENDSGAVHYFYDSGTNRNYVLFSGSTGNLQIAFNDVSVANIASATVKAVWKTNEENVIHISATTGDTSVWLNGTKIQDSGSTAWSPDIISDWVVGNNHTPVVAFSGILSEISIFHTSWTDQEVADDIAGTTYTELDASKALVSLQGRARYKEIQSNNLFVDGDMEASGISDWTITGSSTVTKETGSPHSGTQCLRVAYDGVNNPGVYQTITVVNNIYTLTGWARSDGISVPKIYDGGGLVIWSGTTSTDWQEIYVNYKATRTSISLYCITTVASYAEFDDFVLYGNDIKTKNLGTLDDLTCGIYASTGSKPTFTPIKTITFDGGDYMTTEEVDFDSTDSYLLHCRFTSTGVGFIMDGRDASLKGIACYVNGTGTIAVVSSGSAVQYITTTETYNDGIERDLVVTWNNIDASNVQVSIRVDGELIKTQSLNVPTAGKTTISIGNSKSFTPFQGTMKDVGFWRTSCTPRQAKYLYDKSLKILNV